MVQRWSFALQINRIFYPSHDAIRVHVNNRINELRHFTDDQENLLEKIKEWREKYPDDNIFLDHINIWQIQK